MLSILAQIPTVPVTSSSTLDFTWLFIKMLSVLGIVTVLAILILKYAVPHIGFMKKFHKGRFFKIITRYSLEHRKNLYLIQAGKRYLVIGSSENGINLIKEIDEKEAMEEEADSG